MTKEEAIKVLNQVRQYTDYPKEAFTMAIDALSQPSLPSNLDEAAEEALDEDFGANWYIDERDDGCAEPGYNQKQMLLMFKAGAEWMAGQGCTVEVDEGYFINNPRNDRREGKFHKYYSSVFGHSKKITVTPGDNLIIQIRRSNPAKA